MKLLILGAGGHGVNCLEIARSMESFDEIAFLDDGYIDVETCGCPVIGKLEDVARLHEAYDYAFPAFGDNIYRLQWLKQLAEYGYNVPKLISPQACISTYARIGQGSVVFPFVAVEPRADIGQGTILSAGVVVNHDSGVGDGVLIYSNSVIRPYAVLGNAVKIGSGVVVVQGEQVPAQREIFDGTIWRKTSPK